MAQKLYEETNIQAIANAIRDKNGLTTTYKTSEMAAAIAAIPTGGGGGYVPTDEELTFRNNQPHRFAQGGFDWVIKQYGNRITTEKLQDCTSMFEKSSITEIPFELNFSTSGLDLASLFSDCYKIEQIPDITFNCSTYYDTPYFFYACKSLKNLPYLYNFYPGSLSNFFAYCNNLREFPEDYFDTWNFNRIQTYKYGYANELFTYCYSLRKIPSDFLSKVNGLQAYNYSYIKGSFNSCYVLDELVNLPISSQSFTSNGFISTFNACHRLKNLTFETNDDGTPKTAAWKNQIIDLHTHPCGYAQSNSLILDYNSGITADKEVTDDASYQALKDDPDWYTCNVAYSRYNHDSAVATINSLPNTIATGTNTIKFRGASGELTDGGAINTLTEEEIAVATAKGWTVTLA